MLKQIRNKLRNHGVSGLLGAAARRIVAPRAKCLARCREGVRDRLGLEIGGPSRIFGDRGLLPLYAAVGQLDNCNFGGETLWEGRLQEGSTFVFDRRRPPGRQFIAEATDLAPIAAGRYDFVLSSHALEHSANPLRALREFTRVMKPSGLLVLVLPHRDGAFDHRRPVSTLAHLIEDDEQGMREDDLTHLPEILALHDLALDPEAGDAAAFKARSERNVENRCLHHHVFDESLAAAMVAHAGFRVEAVEFAPPMNIIVVAGKGVPLQSP